MILILIKILSFIFFVHINFVVILWKVLSNRADFLTKHQLQMVLWNYPLMMRHSGKITRIASGPDVDDVAVLLEN